MPKKSNKNQVLSVGQLLQHIEDRVESHIQITIKQFQNLPEEILLRPSATGGWSIAQCLEHLNSYGDFYLPEISKALQNKNHLPSSKIFRSGWFGAYFIKMMEPGNGKKMKAFKAHIPPPDLSGAHVVARFLAQQEEMLGYLRKAPTVDLEKVRIPISISKLIKLKLGHVFQFCTAHDARHIAQAQRNLI